MISRLEPNSHAPLLHQVLVPATLAVSRDRGGSIFNARAVRRRPVIPARKMSKEKSAEEILARNIGRMGDELGRLYTALDNHVVWIHWHWYEFDILFGRDGQKIEALNRTAPFFFRMIQQMFWRDILLRLSYLVAPTDTFGKENLTLKLLPDVVHDTALSSRLRTMLEDLDSHSSFVTDWRNRSLAHKDLRLAIGDKSKPLPPATVDSVQICLDHCAAILDAVNSHYFDATTAFSIGHFSSGAESLLHTIQNGLRWEEALNHYYDTGEIPLDLFDKDGPSNSMVLRTASRP